MKRWSLVLLLSGSLAGCGNSTPPSSVTSTSSESAPPSTAAETTASVSYDQLLQSADELMQKKQVKEAVQTLTKAIQAEPQRTEAYLKRSAILAEAKLLAEAIADLTSALKIDPQQSKVLNTRGYFFLISQNYERANQDFSDAIGLDLNYPQPYNNRGLALIAQGKFEEATKDFDNALRLKPEYLDAHNNRGFALMQLNRPEEAVASFSRAIELDAKYINALANRGRCYLKLNRPADAVGDFNALIALQPDAAGHYTSRSEAFRMAGDMAAANADLHFVDWLKQLDEINQRLVRNTRDADAWADRGRHLLMQNRSVEARRSLENALTLKPEHPHALVARAQMLMIEKKYPEAIADCTKALASDQRFEIYSLRGDAYVATGDYAKAIDDYSAARRFDRQVVETYRQRAKLLRAAGNETQAKMDEEFASGLEKQLTEAISAAPAATPRAMVIEQVKYEETTAAPAPPKTTTK